ncbi:MAG: HAD-IIB family hydrolase [Erysipelotrichaceae bacterium]|nr:HAD-IIB family hydrolase [Erysipelotrichaceae bacterium]MDY5252656.1 HAD-IIB family hydrolase [Erysipelotrichaceae bacterium]
MKLLASDYDGTLRMQDKVDVAVIEAIKAFQAAGNIFGIATGRCIDLVKCELDGQNIPYDFIIGNNGGTIIDKNGKLLENNLLDTEIAKKILQILGSFKPDQLGVSDGLTYATNYPMLETLMPSLRFYDYQKPDVLKVIAKGDITSIFVYFKDFHKKQKAMAAIKGLIENLACSTNDEMISVCNKGINKQYGVATIAKYFNVDEVYVIGDDYNDVEMVAHYHGFTVERANKMIKKIASKQFKDVKEAIEYLMG